MLCQYFVHQRRRDPATDVAVDEVHKIRQTVGPCRGGGGGQLQTGEHEHGRKSPQPEQWDVDPRQEVPDISNSRFRKCMPHT